MSDKVRVHEIAKELGINSKEVVEKSIAIGLNVKTASSSVSMSEAEQIMNYFLNGAPSNEVLESKPADVKEKIKKESEKQVHTTLEVANDSESKVIEDVVPQIVEQAHIEPVKEPRKELLKEVEPIKRVGLKIVKKRREEVVEPVYTKSEQAFQDETKKLSSYGKLSAQALEELAQKKKKKQQIQVPTTKKHTSGNRLDMFGGDIADISMDIEGEEIVLMDLNESVMYVEDVADVAKKVKDKKPVGRNSGAKKATSGKGHQVSREKRKKYTKDVTDEVVTHVEIPEDIRVYEFAEKLKRPISDIIKVLFNLGIMATKNDFLGKDEIEILAAEFEIEVTTIDPKDAFNYEDEYAHSDEDDNSKERPPVITIMGHVDHGKTSLLDKIRSSRVANGEAGGITQHIGAYSIKKNGKDITFIDTPGHAAFSAMPSRGAQATDIIIVVVAADDGVKPQTKEAVKLAKESKAPVLVAMNKMDKENANPDMVKAQMAELGLTPVDWGGDVEFIPVSAKSGDGIEELLEHILVTAEVLELKANYDAPAKAVIVESSLEKGYGPVGTVIVQNGTLRVGDNVVCGSAYGRVRSLLDDNKKPIKDVKPSGTAVVVGLNEVPVAGEILMVMSSDREAKEYAQKRHEYDRHKELSHSTKTTLDELTSLIAEGNLKTLKVVLKTDVHGSLEAIKSSLSEMRNDEVKIDVISSGVGGITENDVELVSNSSNCALLGFNVRPTGNVKALAKQKGVEIKTYSIIYQLIDDMTGMLTGMMAPKYTEEQSGQAEVREVFKIPKGVVAGCVVSDGKLTRGGLVRVIRQGVVIYEGELTSLKRFKDDVSEVGRGYECGVVIKGYEDVKAGDVIETFKKIEQKVEL